MNRLFVNCQVHMIHCESSAKVAEGRLNCKKRGHPPGAKRRNLYFPKSILAPRSKTARAFTTGLRTIQGGQCAQLYTVLQSIHIIEHFRLNTLPPSRKEPCSRWPCPMNTLTEHHIALKYLLSDPIESNLRGISVFFFHRLLSAS